MSASLVGSEMCIRDRGAPWAGRCRSAAPAAFCRPARQRGPQQHERFCYCLLYTSDAADDM
eukprot:2779908-Alexandrium_andersonii.AAC.1